MSIPLDRLYHYINDIAEQMHQDRVLIYRFFPHGSKKLEELKPLRDPVSWMDQTIDLNIYAVDQEPLSYNLYQVSTPPAYDSALTNPTFVENFKLVGKSAYTHALLIHSEKRSAEVKKYQDSQYIDVYYWSHAIIALDWFRYARHTYQKKQATRPFLIYNRAWSGTREYRLKFAEYLLRLGLEHSCRMSLNPVEPELGIHYELHKFSNPDWRPNYVLENHFPKNDAESHYSADFDIKDYESTDIEVVLETLFDDSRLHLTEKTLRPIACAQPFILASTHGSLEYLRSYGFKTFGHIWDERYDLVEDPVERLTQIADLMKQISTWLPQVRERKMAQAQAIADYNRRHFFSQEFFNLITNELKINLSKGFATLEKVNSLEPYITLWEHRLSTGEDDLFLTTNQDVKSPTLDQVNKLLQILKSRSNK